MKIYSQENLLNSLSLLKGTEITFLLGAGCSISSGCMAASKLIDEFRKRIYCSEHGLRYDDNTLINDVNFKKILLQEEKRLKMSHIFGQTVVSKMWMFYRGKIIETVNEEWGLPLK